MIRARFILMRSPAYEPITVEARIGAVPRNSEYIDYKGEQFAVTGHRWNLTDDMADENRAIVEITAYKR